MLAYGPKGRFLICYQDRRKEAETWLQRGSVKNAEWIVIRYRRCSSFCIELKIADDIVPPGRFKNDLINTRDITSHSIQ